jgi:hypothetical protein
MDGSINFSVLAFCTLFFGGFGRLTFLPSEFVFNGWEVLHSVFPFYFSGFIFYRLQRRCISFSHANFREFRRCCLQFFRFALHPNISQAKVNPIIQNHTKSKTMFFVLFYKVNDTKNLKLQ